MKKMLTVITMLALFLHRSPVIAEELVIVGTGSGPPILKAIGLSFTNQNPDVKISVPRSIGSGGGIKAVGTENYLLARVARGIKANEKKYNLTYVPIAHMPVVFFANKNVTVKNLTKEQVLDIYSGKIYNWREIDGRDARIRVIRRQEGDSSLGVLRKKFPNFKNTKITSLSKTTYSDPDNIDLTEKTPDAIAFGTYCDVVNREVNTFSIDDVHPTGSDYPYFATFGLVYKEKNKRGVVKTFLEYVTSASVDEVIIQSGGVPIKK